MLPWICSVALWVRVERVRTSSATTAKPRPCSPARAASMAAFSASRLVCSAMPWISPMTLPIRSDSFASSTAEWKACSACLASSSICCSV
ncbi:hypothetical protein D3C80_2059780 [compost metagenome]